MLVQNHRSNWHRVQVLPSTTTQDSDMEKDIPVSYLESKWQSLLKDIFAYITCESRYNRIMFYHFKLLNHFTGRTPINLPHYLHKALTKMAQYVKVKPNKVSSILSHQGLITLIVKESLKKKYVDWNFFLFWNKFQLTYSQKTKRRNLPQKNHPLLGAAEGKGRQSHLLRPKQRHHLSISKEPKGN